MHVEPELPVDRSRLPDPAQVMRPERLATLVPTRLSAARSLMNLMIRDRWRIETVQFDIDDRSRGQAVYRVHTPSKVFDFMVFSFEPTLTGRTGRIIGTNWDMMGSLVEGRATSADIATTREQMPKLYAGRGTPGTLVWCRSNRSLRLFDHLIERLASGRQPDVDELRRVGYIMRNTGLDGNGTFGTRSYLALEDDHPLRLPYHAQMLAAYLMREFAVDLVEHLARTRAADAVTLAPQLKRLLGLGNGSALGLVFFANTHPELLDRWLTVRFAAVAEAGRIPLVEDTPEWRRACELLTRAQLFYEQDPFAYEAFTQPASIADDLRLIGKRMTELAQPGAEVTTFAALSTATRGEVCAEAREVLHAIMLELRPDQTDRWLHYLPGTDALDRDPCGTVGELAHLIDREYSWALAIDLQEPGQRHYRWYKSADAEEPRRGPVEEVPDGLEWALDLPGDVQVLRQQLTSAPQGLTVGEFLAEHGEHRWLVQRIQGLAGRRYHSPHMNMLAEDFIPAHVIRMVNAGFHGLDKTVDAFGRSVLGLIFHGAPTREEIAAGTGADWIYPCAPQDSTR